MAVKPLTFKSLSYWNILNDSAFFRRLLSVVFMFTFFYVTQTYTYAQAPTFSNYSEDPTLSTSFAHRKGANSTPKFTVTSLTSFNAIEIELNTQSDFSGTSFVTTINTGTTYNANTLYDFWTTTPLTGVNQTYFARCRVSSNGGATYSPWSVELWPYSYFPTTSYPMEGWYYTTGEQFGTGVVQEALYDNTIVNTTPFPDDGNITLDQGAYNLTISNNADQYLTEGSTNYSGASYDYHTVGSFYSGGARQDYNGFRFTGFSVPNGASILSSNLRVYSHHRGNEPISNNSNPLYLEIVGVNQTNVNTW